MILYPAILLNSLISSSTAKECSNYHTIALISHTSKVILKILHARLQQYVNRELLDVQVGFRKGTGTRDQIANIRWIMEKARELQKNIYSALTTIRSDQIRSVAQSCPTLCKSLNCNPPGSSVHGVFQASVLEWVAIFFSRGSSQSRDQTHISCVSCIAGRFLTCWANIAACKLFSCRIWNPVPWPGIEPWPPALRERSLSYWATRKVLVVSLCKVLFFFLPEWETLFCWSSRQGSSLRTSEIASWCQQPWRSPCWSTLSCSEASTHPLWQYWGSWHP